MLALRSGSACSRNQPATACPASWYATIFFSSGNTSLLDSNPPMTRSAAACPVYPPDDEKKKKGQEMGRGETSVSPTIFEDSSNTVAHQRTHLPLRRFSFKPCLVHTTTLQHNHIPSRERDGMERGGGGSMSEKKWHRQYCTGVCPTPSIPPDVIRPVIIPGLNGTHTVQYSTSKSLISICFFDLLAATMAASLHRFSISAPAKPGVKPASLPENSSAFPLRLSPFRYRSKISFRPLISGLE